MGINQHFDISDARPLTSSGTGDIGEKLLGLELLRFTSALAVLFYHYHHFAKIPGAASVARVSAPFYAIFWPFYDYGQFGVQIFWGISGYIFFWKYGAAINAGHVRARKFFWLRFSRLYPLHLVTLFAVLGLQVVHRGLTGLDFQFTASDPGFFLRQLFLATDWGALPDKSFNGPIWSISAEVAVYAAFFAIMLRVKPSWQLCLGMVLGALLLNFGGLHLVPIVCAAYFFAGGLAAMSPAHWRRQAAFVLGVGVAACVATGYLRDLNRIPFAILLALPCLLMALAQGWPWLDRWSRQIEAAGNLTYSSYLLHFPLQLIVAILVAATGISLPLADPRFLLGYIGLTLAAATLCYRLFELPAQDWLRRKTLGSPAKAYR